MRELKKKIAVLFLAFALVMPIVATIPIEAKAQSTKVESAQTIVDEETPLAAAEDLCVVHWIILAMTLGMGAYTVVRVASVAKQHSEENEQAKAVQ